MNAKGWIAVGGIVSAVAVLTALAVAPAPRTFRTTASVRAVLPTVNPLTTNDLLLVETFAGHDLVNLALGQSLATVTTNQVLALELNCGSDQASLVVFDRTLASNVLVIATSTHVDALDAQDSPALAGPNRERFVAQMSVNTNGFIIGGFMTIAGRAFLDPSTGCPTSVLKDTDHRNDKGFADGAVKNTDIKTEKDKALTGHAHLIGVVNIVFLDGSTNTVLLPFGQLTMRRQLLP